MNRWRYCDWLNARGALRMMDVKRYALAAALEPTEFSGACRLRQYDARGGQAVH